MTRIRVFLFTFLVFLVYLLSGNGVHTRHDFFVPLAQSFWQGKLYIEEMRGELHEMVSQTEIETGNYLEPVDGVKDRYYVIYPPLPAVILMPFVAIQGSETNQSLVSLIVAVVGLYVMVCVLLELKLGQDRVIWLAILYVFGTTVWYHSLIGSAWYFASICALLFTWLAILFTLQKRSLWLIGVVVGAAYLCRYNLILMTPFFLWMNRERWSKYIAFLAPVLISLVLSFGYNYVRYGRIDHFGYKVLESRSYNLENEYTEGSYDLSYAPRHIRAALWTFPVPSNEWPYIKPNMDSMAIWIVFPAIFIALLAPLKSEIVKASLVVIALLLPATIFHGGVGASQFGYRYVLDYLPFIFIFLAEVVRGKIFGWQKMLIALSIGVNLWGVVSILWMN